ncbi:MAG: hypothetical protein HQ488_02660 [Parcubacteria group bacterium]|nr:hypothetical protein [Parcubacteria group bacterium]
MLKQVLTVSTFLAIMALLIMQRFSLPPEVTVFDINSEETYERGELIKTTDGYLAIQIGESRVYLGKNTVLELDRIYTDQLTITLTKGRLLVDATGNIPLVVETNHTDHLIHKGLASFINYDWLETIHVIPISGSVQTTIRGTNDYLLTPLPLSIHETDPVSYQAIEVTLTTGPAADFYSWTDVTITETENFNPK